MIVIGIETSCDETAVAIVDDNKNILSNLVISQIEIHKEFGGVVPEIAARNHIEVIDKLINKALLEAKIELADIDAVAVTAGPGLIGGLIVGIMMAKSIALALNKPIVAVNHLEGHILTPRLTNDIEFPFLALLVSGGHCQILRATNIGEYKLIGETIDDALGECFDKVAQMIGESYPGGPIIEKLALDGDENKFKFPKPLVDKDFEKKNIYNFSFSGLKTAVRRKIEELTGETFSLQSANLLSLKEKRDICASFQKTVTNIIINRLTNVLTNHDNLFVESKKGQLIISGGVAANSYITQRLQDWAGEDISIITPELQLCTDNAAMIAWAGIEKIKKGHADDLNFKPLAKWNL